MRKKENPESLIKNGSTRLRFSVYVIIANFIMGIAGMVLGSDLTALGVFLGLSNAPLYAYVLGRSFRPASIPKEYYEQPHGGSGGLGNIINDNYGEYDDYGGYGEYDDYSGYDRYDYDDRNRNRRYSTSIDNYNIPDELLETSTKPGRTKTIKKDIDEIG
jgi:hypothetical protein